MLDYVKKIEPLTFIKNEFEFPVIFFVWVVKCILKSNHVLYFQILDIYRNIFMNSFFKII